MDFNHQRGKVLESPGRERGRRRTTQLPDEDEFHFESLPSSSIGRSHKSPTLNINICFPTTKYDDSSDESSSGENYFRNLRLHFSSPSKKNDTRDKRNSPEREQTLDSIPNFGCHKKRIITPPHKLRSNLVHSKKLRLEKGRNHHRGSRLNLDGFDADSRPIKASCSHADNPSSSRDDLNILKNNKLEKGDGNKREKGKLNEDLRDRAQNNPRLAENDDLSDIEFDAMLKRAYRNEMRKRPRNLRDAERDRAVPSTSVDRWQDVNSERPCAPAMPKAKTSLWKSVFSSDDEDILPTRVIPRNTKPTADHKNDNSSDSDIEYTWIGPSPRSRPSLSKDFQRVTSVPDEHLSSKSLSKINKPLELSPQRQKTSTAMSSLPVLTATQSEERHLHPSSPVQRLLRKKHERSLYPSNINSSDADGSSNANSSNEHTDEPGTSRRSMLGCRPKTRILRSSSESEESRAPISNINLDIAPESPGVADALQKIQQMEADEAFARLLQFELNQDLYGHERTSEAPPSQLAATAMPGASRSSTQTFPKRNPYSRATRASTQIPTPPVRSTQSRTPRGRTCRHSQTSILDSPDFAEPFTDDSLDLFISNFEPSVWESELIFGGPSSNGRHRVESNAGYVRPFSNRRGSPRRTRPRRSFALMPVFISDGTDYEDLLAFEDRAGQVPVGMNRAQIHRLPTKQYVVNANEGYAKYNDKSEEDNCHICLCDYELGENLRILPCFHEFHTPCIDQWLQVKDTCPVCRMQVKVD